MLRELEGRRGRWIDSFCGEARVIRGDKIKCANFGEVESWDGSMQT